MMKSVILLYIAGLSDVYTKCCYGVYMYDRVLTLVARDVFSNWYFSWVTSMTSKVVCFTKLAAPLNLPFRCPGTDVPGHRKDKR